MVRSQSLTATLSMVAIASLGFPPLPASADTAKIPDVTSRPAKVMQPKPSRHSATLSTVVVMAQRLNAERSQIETQTGASTYTISQAQIAAAPGGENVPLNQVLLQAPDVVQDSFGQIHVRGDHNDLQYRLNGIIIPEGINVFGQTLDPRLFSSVSLITGALPAEYGLDTAGIIDMTTNSGALQPGGYVSLYGGSHGTVQPSFAYGGSRGSLNYYVTYDELINDLGIEAPDASVTPLHDHSIQGHGFAYLEDILDPNDRISLIVGTSDAEYEIPNVAVEQPSLGYTVNGVGRYLSNNLNERQHELTQYGILTWQRALGALTWQTSLSARYTSLHFAPDWTGDLLYNGIAQDAFKADTALAWQTDASYRLTDAHTLRFGGYLQHDNSTSDTASQVLPIDPAGAQTSDVPLTVIQNGTQSQEIESAYLQDEWKLLTTLTVNYGLRFDHYNAYSSGSQVSPRLNVVWRMLPGTTVHAGYSRYFTPPPFELIAGGTFTQFAGTSAVPPGTETQDTPPVAARADYYDVGVEQKLLARKLTLGVDSYYENAQHLIDEGQFGAPIVLTPFNYRYGRIEGVELTSSYTVHRFMAYANLAFQSAKGKDVVSSQFNFASQQLGYIAEHYIHLDHEERVSASAGVSYDWLGTRLSADMIFGTGLRQDLVLPDGFVIPNGDHTPSYTQVNIGVSRAFVVDGSGPLTVRLDVINLFDKIYEIRSGSGVGVFAPQYGPRRGIFGGAEWDF
ncbi:MAG: TonB-dependent receptor [Pseudomonadota bacterium]|nr:TonB-dependent receptor [Pseudomonadota bacterium]